MQAPQPFMGPFGPEPARDALVVQRILRSDAADHAAQSPELRRLLNLGVPGDEFGRTPLMLACWFGAIRCANLLRKMGADGEAVDDLGQPVSWYMEHHGQGMREEQALRDVSAETVRLSMNQAVRAMLDEHPIQSQQSPTAAAGRSRKGL